MESMVKNRYFRNKYRYRNIFLVASILSAGNTVEYFRNNSKILVAYYFLITLRNRSDFVEIYHQGKLYRKKEFTYSSIPLFKYLFIYINFLKLIFFSFPKKEKVTIIGFHPLFFLMQKIIKRIRKFQYVLWVIDYMPYSNFSIWLYQRFLFYVHKHSDHSIYLADPVNQIMNKKANYDPKKTVMWGIKKSKYINRKTDKYTLAFIGTIRRSDGLEDLIEVIADDVNLKLKILGECNTEYYQRLKNMISQKNLDERIDFKNMYYNETQLLLELSTCSVGVALYEISKTNPVYYTDPGKVKTYIQHHLPVIMTKTSAIYPLIEKFHAGRIVNQEKKSVIKAIYEIQSHYSIYQKGIERLATFFEYNRYYRKKFKFLE